MSQVLSLHSCSRICWITIHIFKDNATLSLISTTADGDRWILSAHEFANVMLKAGYEEKEKSFRDLVLRASSESAAGAAVRFTKMSVVARRHNEG